MFRQFGGQGGRGVTDSLRALTMHRALEGLRPGLTLFAEADGRTVPALLRLRQELSAAGTSPEEFGRTAQRLGLAKLKELALLLQGYDALLTERFGGTGDMLQALWRQLETSQGHAFFAGKIIAVDAFWGFTQMEAKILGRIFSQAAEVYVTLCADGVHENDGAEVFAHTRRTAAQLRRLAQEAGVPVATTRMLPEDGAPLPRFVGSPALAALETALVRESAKNTCDASRSIALLACEDVETECAAVAAEIKRLLREEGFRCREIAVLARNADDYERPFFAALRRVGVPLFADMRQPVEGQPLMRLVTEALAIAARGLETDTVLRLLKTGLTTLNDEEIALAEDYALLWRVRGDGWLRHWKAHPQGLGDYLWNEQTDAQLAQLNALREKIAWPLQNFRQAMRNCTGVSGGAAVYALLQQLCVPGALKQLREVLISDEQQTAAGELIRVWDLCMEMLDQIARVTQAEPLGAGAYAELFGLVLGMQTLGQLPQSLDAVTFGAADRVRFQTNKAAPRAVFVLGLNDGAFPKVPGDDGLVTDRERAALKEAGLAMQDGAAQQLAMEQLIAYRSLTAPRERLWCSWALRNAAAEELRPARWVRWLRERFPEVPVRESRTRSPLENLEGESAGFVLLCDEQARHSALYNALLEYFWQDARYAPRLAALRRTAGEKPETLRLSADAAQALYRGAAHISPSQAERYARCPFQHFCVSGLRLQSPKRADFDPLFRGSALHAILERLLRQNGTEALLQMAQPQRQAALHAVMDNYAAEHLEIAGLPARVTYLYRRLRDIAGQVLERMLAQFAASTFRPVAFELQIDMDQPVKPYQIALPGGGTVALGGKADRVDCAVVNGQTYFRVIDYKTGNKDFALGAVFEGLNLQMLVYLFALWKSNVPPYAGALPAGVLYEQTKDPVLAVGVRAQTPEEIAREKQDAARAEGFVLEDADVLCAMEEGGAGIFLPAKCGGDGALENHVLSLERLGKLRRAVEDVLAQEVLALRAGTIPAAPLRSQTFSPCAWCDYQTVCGHEPGGAVRWETKMCFEEAVKRLDELYS
jgi:ATP-dependent helicase/nuclease subunit B